MKSKVNDSVNMLLDMAPDPIPRFILLKEFKGITSNDAEYRNLYEQVCSQRYVKTYETTQNERGFWQPFHGYTESIIRKLLSFGLDKKHICLKRVSDYLVKVLNNEEEWNQYEKQDNPLWYPKMFMPLVSAAMLSLIDNDNPVLQNHRQQWSYIAEASFSYGTYDRYKNIEAINACFGIYTNRLLIITVFYY